MDCSAIRGGEGKMEEEEKEDGRRGEGGEKGRQRGGEGCKEGEDEGTRMMGGGDARRKVPRYIQQTV
jgi:hypothetical protein